MKTEYALILNVFFSNKNTIEILTLRTHTHNRLIFCLLQVSLGNMNELLNADYSADKLPSGKHSVWGKGRVAPDPKKIFVT